MKRAALLTIGILALAALAPGAAVQAQSKPADQVVQPGYWKYDTDGPLGSDDTDFRCVRPQDVRKFLAPCNSHNTCTYSVQDLADGNAHYEGVWVSNKNGASFRVSAQGTYSERRFHLNATVRLPIIPIPIQATITATWQSETCPAGAKGV